MNERLTMRTRTGLRQSRVSAFAALFVMLTSVSRAAEPTVETNVVFATYSGLALVMDVYRPATSNGFGIVVINGSGWYRDLDSNAPLLKESQEFRSAREKLVAAGYTAIVLTVDTPFIGCSTSSKRFRSTASSSTMTTIGSA
jgi:hypothetical protein